jgi:hypothetical protein
MSPPPLLLQPCVGLCLYHGVVVLPQPSNLEDQQLHFIWPLPFDLPGMGDPATSLSSHQFSSLGHWGMQTSSAQYGGSP